MGFSYNTSLSGLNANSNALNVAGNNIANSNTIGFRASSITFADVFASANGARLNGAGMSLTIGDGVRTAAVHTNFEQGSLNESGSPLHAAISGNGFFVLRNANGVMGYTRAGDFGVNKEGYIVAPDGAQVQGYTAENGIVGEGAPLGAIRLPLGETLPPKITSQATFKMNLDSTTVAGTDFHSSVQVFDSKGEAHTMDLTYTKQADGSFNMSATIDGNPAQTSVNGGAASATPVKFTFDANGYPTGPTSLSIVPDNTKLNGSTLNPIALNLRETNADGTPGNFNITNFARPSAVAATIQDGFAASELNGVGIDPSGVIMGIFSNGQSRIMGQVALGSFNAPEALSRQGGNLFAETIASGQATIGKPNSGGRGSISGGMLEQSNVNISNEFIKLIEAQRGFQANSRVITTLNQTFQDLLQIV